MSVASGAGRPARRSPRRRSRYSMATIKKQLSHKPTSRERKEKTIGDASRRRAARGRARRAKYALTQNAFQTLGANASRADVRLPAGEKLQEWLAEGLIDMYNHVILVYAGIHEHCTDQRCPVMNAGGGYRYAWRDGHKYRKPTECAAPVYINLLMDWIDSQLEDEGLFPLESGSEFPTHFVPQVRVILKRLFRVYAHIYHAHFDAVTAVKGGVETINTCFKYFCLFCSEFRLVDKEDVEPMRALLKKWDLWKGFADRSRRRHSKVRLLDAKVLAPIVRTRTGSALRAPRLSDQKQQKPLISPSGLDGRRLTVISPGAVQQALATSVSRMPVLHEFTSGESSQFASDGDSRGAASPGAEPSFARLKVPLCEDGDDIDPLGSTRSINSVQVEDDKRHSPGEEDDDDKIVSL